MNNDQFDDSTGKGYLYEDTIDIPQAQTKDRLAKEKAAREETYLQQQRRLKSEKRWAWFVVFFALAFVGVVIAGQIIMEASR